VAHVGEEAALGQAGLLGDGGVLLRLATRHLGQLARLLGLDERLSLPALCRDGRA